MVLLKKVKFFFYILVAENLALTSITSFDSNLGKRKISESLQINNAASDSFMETKRPRLEQGKSSFVYNTV